MNDKNRWTDGHNRIKYEKETNDGGRQPFKGNSAMVNV